MKNIIFAALIIGTSLILWGCGGNTAAKDKPQITLNISAAISMKDALEQVAKSYSKEHENVKVVYNFASSGVLMSQIEEGAPVDIFISAGKKQVQELEDKGLILKDCSEIIVSNKLVLIKPKQADLKLDNLEELTGNGVKKVAVGNPVTVPAGQYAKAALEGQGIWNKIKSKLVFTNDVRQVLSYAETGNIDAGIVYSSDALLSARVEAVAIDTKLYPSIKYPAVIIKDSENAAMSKEFLQFCLSEKAQKIFKSYGFAPPGGGE